MGRTPPQPEHDESEAKTDAPRKYIEDPHAACVTAAYKINVVIRILRGLEGLDDSGDAEALDDGGYGLTMAQDLLGQIRNELQESIAHVDAKQQGGAK